MRSFLIVYEDKYGVELHRLVQRVRRDDLAIPAVIIQQPQTARGTGGFANEVRSLINLPFSRGAEGRS